MSNGVPQIKIHSIYSFDSYAPEKLGLHFKNVRMLAIMDAQSAIREGIDVIAWHEQIRSHLPSGYNDDPMTMVYLKIKSATGEETIISKDWINLSTLTETSSNRVVVTIDDVSQQDVETIRRILVTSGFPNISIKLTNVD